MSSVVNLDRRRRHVETIQDMVDEIHRQFGEVKDAEWKAESSRIYAGKLLLSLRERIEAGEDGEGVNWWEWYEAHFVRSRKDAEKVMRLARSEDPEAALEEYQEADREKHLEQSSAPLVERAMRLVRRMTTQERETFVKMMESEKW